MNKRKKIIFITTTVLLIIVFVELFSYVLYENFIKSSVKLGTYNEMNCGDVFQNGKLNYPHGVVYRKNPKCEVNHINSSGFSSREFPIVKNDMFYHVLIVGGSVAEGFYLYKSKYQKELISGFENRLNENFTSPKGKIIRLYNAARVDHRQPQQISFLMNYIDMFDVVISIEGYNENWAIVSKLFIPNPPAEFFMLENKHKYQNYLTIRNIIRNSEMLDKTYFAKIMYKYVLNLSYDELARDLKQNEGSIFVTESQAIKRYVHYLKVMDGLCGKFKKDCLVFFQPTPALYKKLTHEERLGAILDSEKEFKKTGELYSRTIQEQLENKEPTIEKISLLKAFQNESRRMYVDNIHFADVGMDIIQETILDILLGKKIIKVK